MHVAIVMGTRPEAVKLAPVARRLRDDARFGCEVWSTGQHRELLDQVVESFGLDVAVDLDLMRPDQGLAELFAAATTSVAATIRERRPDALLVQGDTATAAAAALAAFFEGVPVGHVEAGLRSGDLAAPFPEEANRRIVSVLAAWHFAPTRRAADALLAEGADPDAVHVTGNPVVDALHEVASWPAPDGFDERFGDVERLVVATAHRREHFGDGLVAIADGLARVARTHPDVTVVLPVHPNPNVEPVIRARLGDVDNVRLTEPLDHPTVVHLLKRAELVITDSGGLQEEAPVFGVPVLVTRDVTERPEGVDAGTAELVGPDATRIADAATRLLTDPDAHAAMARAVSPYGDGRAAERIVDLLADTVSP